MILNIFFDKWINIFFQVDRKILLGALEMSLEIPVPRILAPRRKLTNKFEWIVCIVQKKNFKTYWFITIDPIRYF